MIEKDPEKSVRINDKIVVSEIKIVLTNNIVEEVLKVSMDFVEVERNVMHSWYHQEQRENIMIALIFIRIKHQHDGNLVFESDSLYLLIFITHFL